MSFGSNAWNGYNARTLGYGHLYPSPIPFYSRNLRNNFLSLHGHYAASYDLSSRFRYDQTRRVAYLPRRIHISEFGGGISNNDGFGIFQTIRIIDECGSNGQTGYL